MAVARGRREHCWSPRSDHWLGGCKGKAEREVQCLTSPMNKSYTYSHYHYITLCVEPKIIHALFCVSHIYIYVYIRTCGRGSGGRVRSGSWFRLRLWLRKWLLRFSFR